MCLIAYADVATLLKNIALLKEAEKQNPHGGGLVSRGERLAINPAFGLNYQLKIASGVTALHFRWATKGAKSQQNVHPFDLGDSYLFHNGTVTLNEMIDFVMSSYDDINTLNALWESKQYSDTRVLAYFLKNKSLEEKNHILHCLAAYSSKFLLWEKGSDEIFEFGQFYDLDGMRVSNFYSFPSLYYQTYEYEDEFSNAAMEPKQPLYTFDPRSILECSNITCLSSKFDSDGSCMRCSGYAVEAYCPSGW